MKYLRAIVIHNINLAYGKNMRVEYRQHQTKATTVAIWTTASGVSVRDVTGELAAEDGTVSAAIHHVDSLSFVTELSPVDRARSEADRRRPRHDGFPPARAPMSSEALGEVAENYHPVLPSGRRTLGVHLPPRQTTPASPQKQPLNVINC